LNDVGLEARGVGSGTDALVMLDGSAGGTAVTTQSVSIVVVEDDTTDLDTQTTKNVVVLDGDFATAALVETAIETGGSRAITVGAASFTENASNFVIVWDDGSNTYIGIASVIAGSVDTGGVINDGETFDDVTVTTLVTLVGVDDATAIIAANLGTTFL
jgi:hypothetical protein